MIEFDGIVPALGRALEKRGYAELTPVQKAVLGRELEGNADALVSAQTGSGKTVAFGLAIAPTLLEEAERFERAEAPLALAVAPTRELALQVKRELEWLYEFTGANVASCVGGMDMRTERRALSRGAHIVVGTPGRLRDHIERGSLNVSKLKAVVLDEADEMLDLGFRDDLEFILASTPDERRTLLFSATVPRAIANLAKKFQRDAVRITTAGEQKQHLDIEYRALTVAASERENAIVNVLRFYEAKSTLVFCATRATVNHMSARFNNRGFAVVSLSGELSQAERTHALQAMRDGRARVCIATDVAARGLDLPSLDLVIHADLPTNSDTLLHRSGRTGRAGRKGVSVLIVPHNGRRKAERLLGSARIDAKWAKPPSVEDVLGRDNERMLADPIFTEPLLDEEESAAGQLMERFDARQVAGAFLRLHRAGKSAPEELLDVPAPAPKKSRREEFGESVWFSISVGRKQNAEPRWLLPLLCGAGRITKREIGSIKVQVEETFVQIDATRADDFYEALGPHRTLEKNITVKRLDRAPKMAASSSRKPYAGKKSFGGARSGGPGSGKGGSGKGGPGGFKKPKRKFSKKTEGQSEDRGPTGKPGKKADGKKFGKPKAAGATDRGKPKRTKPKQKQG